MGKSRFREVIYVKILEECSIFSKFNINVSCFNTISWYGVGINTVYFFKILVFVIRCLTDWWKVEVIVYRW